MYIDYLCAAALADQVGSLLVGARIQDVIQVDRLTFALELYTGRRHYLIFSADPGHPGLRISSAKARRGADTPRPLSLALASRAEGARLISVTQPAFERILEFGIGRGEQVELRLVAELMGRMGNVILLDPDGRILASARQVTAEMSRARTVLPGQRYAPPPAPAKTDPARLSPAELASWLDAAGSGKAWRVLVARCLGVSPLLAREIVERACGSAEGLAAAVDPDTLLGILRALIQLPGQGAWEPGLAFDTSKVEDAPAAAYAPYRLTHYSAWVACESIADAIEAYHEARTGQDAYAQARAAVSTLLDEARDRAARQVAALERESVDEAGIEALRVAGDLLLAYQWQVEAGATQVQLQGAEGPVRIDLEPGLTAVENAQRLFDRYRRAKRAAEALPKRLALARAHLATLDQLSTDLALAEDRAGIDGVAEDLRERGLLGRPLPKRKAGMNASRKPLALLSSDGIGILVGRNSRQNEVVTFKHAVRGDLWLHARGIPGAHVLIKSGGRELPERTIQEAAGLAAWFSRARGEPRVEVISTDVRHVTRMRGGGQGMVHYRHDQTLIAKPLDPKSLRPQGKTPPLR